MIRSFECHFLGIGFRASSTLQAVQLNVAKFYCELVRQRSIWVMMGRKLPFPHTSTIYLGYYFHSEEPNDRRK